MLRMFGAIGKERYLGSAMPMSDREIEIWNAAIEAAASLAGQAYTKAQANEIRKLKK